jgi:hypothetical protein
MLATIEHRLLYEISDPETKIGRYEALRADLEEAQDPQGCILALMKQVHRNPGQKAAKPTISASDGLMYRLMCMIGRIDREDSSDPAASWRDLRKVRARLEREVCDCEHSIFGRALLLDVVTRAVELRHKEVLQEQFGSQLLGWKDARGCPFGQLVVGHGEMRGQVYLRIRPIGVLVPFISGRELQVNDPSVRFWNRNWETRDWHLITREEYKAKNSWVIV